MLDDMFGTVAPPRHYWDSRYGFHIEEDFNTGYTGLFTLSGNAPIWPQATPLPSGWYGVGGGSTGATSTGSGGTAAFSGTPLGFGPFWCEWKTLLSALSDGTDTYIARCGYIDTATAAPTDMIGFRYTHSTNGGRWECVCRSNNVEAAVDSGVSVAANADYTMRFTTNADATSVAFTINGVAVATITTNIPSGLARFGQPGLSIIKSLGTNARSFYADWCKIDYIFTSPRY